MNANIAANGPAVGEKQRFVSLLSLSVAPVKWSRVASEQK